MNALDIAIIVIVGTTFVMSLFRGLVKEVFALGSLILGFVIANATYVYPAEFLRPYVHSDATVKVLGYVLVFVGASIAIRLLGTFAEKFVRKVLLGWANHLGGAVFGFLKGCLIVSVILMLVTSFMPKSVILQESTLTPYVLSTVSWVARVSTPEIKEKFKATRQELEKIWKTTVQRPRMPALGDRSARVVRVQAGLKGPGRPEPGAPFREETT
jgi:membrane protein required for colicin V production